jgi:prepilin-type N-terminal cleavage/methylation domain-containing protein
VVRRKNKSGFTLLELLIAAAVLMIISIPMFNALTASVKTNAMAHKMSMATFAAQQKVEEFVGLTREEIAESFSATSRTAISNFWDIPLEDLDGDGVDDLNYAGMTDGRETDIKNLEDYHGLTIRVYFTYNSSLPNLEEITVGVFDDDGSTMHVQKDYLNVVPGGF